MRRVSIAALACALFFGILASWLGPKMIAYWYAPPVPAGAATAFNCTDAVTWAMTKLVWTQIIGSLGGATMDNEWNYLQAKLMRALGVVYIENQARI